MREILQQATHVSGLTSSSTLVVRVELDLQIESVKKKFSRITHFLNAFLDLEAEICLQIVDVVVRDKSNNAIC